MVNLGSILNNPPRNATLLAIAVTAVLGLFRLVPLLMLVWVVVLAYIIIYYYKGSRNTEAPFVCLDCATIHRQRTCPKCGSSLKKFYSGTNRYGV
ncbi:MAG: hypothetical protein KGI33_09565 [Thaumarchaeota archaeon]|nr:hypothetical protein [Nitrososphaerota archaeon]